MKSGGSFFKEGILAGYSVDFPKLIMICPLLLLLFAGGGQQRNWEVGSNDLKLKSTFEMVFDLNLIWILELFCKSSKLTWFISAPIHFLVFSINKLQVSSRTIKKNQFITVPCNKQSIYLTVTGHHRALGTTGKTRSKKEYKYLKWIKATIQTSTMSSPRGK